MAKLKELREQAKKAGVPTSEIRGADASELRSLIEEHSGSNGKPRRAVKKSAVKKAATAVRKAGRPKGLKNSKTRAAKPAPAKSKGTAKRRATGKAKATTSAYVPKGGRNVLGDIDYSETDGWNPRAGSAPDRILKLLRKYRGNREKVFDALVGDIGDFVKPRRRNGDKFSKDERQSMLRYRIARTDFDFAIQTGQHEKATNRVEYGTGGTGQGVWKPAKAQKATRSKAKVKATRKSGGRQKAAQTRTKASTRKGTARKQSRKASKATKAVAKRRAAKRNR